jgi:hypothetical protein
MNKPETISTSAIVLNKEGYEENRGVTVLKLNCEEDGLQYKVGAAWHLDRDVIVSGDRLFLLASGQDVIL